MAERVSTRPAAPGEGRARSWLQLAALLFVPAVALWELGAHAMIIRNVPKDSEWRAAHDFIARERRDGDLVASAPWWTDPIARMHLRDLISLRDAARPDATRYPRAFVATIRRGEHPDFAGWSEERSQSFGQVTVRVLRNPHPATVLYDFIEHLHPPDAEVARRESSGERPCAFNGHFRVEGGGLGQGPIAGPERFACGEPWNYVGRVIAEDMDHRGRLCIWSHPVVDVPMRTTFHDVPIGRVVRGHHVVAYEAERGGDHGETGAPITLRIHVGEREVGHAVHTDGDGWKTFEFDTSSMAGTRQTVMFEVTVPSGGNRHYCFEGDTR